MIFIHGSWTRYTPKRIPKDAPLNTMFLRRDSDGKDWYDYVHPGDKFKESSVKFVVRNGIIDVPCIDATALFPDNGTVVEMIGDYKGRTTDQLIAEFVGKSIDLKTGEIK